MALLIEPAATAGLVLREVRTGWRDGAATKIAVARRSYPTNQADLWEALTDPDRLPRWFLPVTGDVTVGGRYQIEGNASGVVEECEAPKRFAVTWEMGPQMSWLQVILTPAADGTTLELSHEAAVDPAFWAQFGPGAVGVGWDLALMGLGLHLSTGAPVDREKGETFPTTPEGQVFVRTAATGWADAAVSDGDASEAAHSAAVRTVAFYTGAPGDDSQP